MTRATIAGGAIALVLILLVLAAAYWFGPRNAERAAAPLPETTTSTGPTALEDHQGFLYGRLTTNDGATYEGRLRWGGDEEAFWGDYFNGLKDTNPWAAHVPPEQLKESQPLEIFGFEIAHWASRIDLRRPFLARFGDITRIEADGRDLRVTLKSGTVFHLDRYAADDFADGIRLWDDRRGVVDFDEGRIRSLELLHTDWLGTVPARLHGTVHTRQGDFSGFVQWDRKQCVGTDELEGNIPAGKLSLRFDTIRSIARSARDRAHVTRLDGREIALTEAGEVGRNGIYVDDQRYGRVLVSWDAFERLDFTPGGRGPSYGDFPPGRPLTGTVTTRSGGRFTGRLVYDLDESETTETLDAPAHGVNYNIPFGLISAIAFGNREEFGARRAHVTLQSGEELQLERTGDLAGGNAGMLIFIDGRVRPEYVRWPDVARVEFDRPPAMQPPPGKR